MLWYFQKNGIQLTGMDCNHPLEKAGLSIQEDLCLMQRTTGGWVLKGASLSFPSRWQLHKKIGKNLWEHLNLLLGLKNMDGDT